MKKDHGVFEKKVYGPVLNIKLAHIDRPWVSIRPDI